jgi:hypothetical protein
VEREEDEVCVVGRQKFRLNGRAIQLLHRIGICDLYGGVGGGICEYRNLFSYYRVETTKGRLRVKPLVQVPVINPSILHVGSPRLDLSASRSIYPHMQNDEECI